MSVIGNPLVTTNYISDSFSGDASTVAFTLSQAPASAASIAVYISGLYQIPTSAYSISGTTLTFTGAPPTGTNNITVLHLGVKSATLVPVAGSVTPQMLSNANVVYWSASNNNVGIGNVTPTSLLTVTGTAALGNTSITGFANVTSTIQGGAGLTIAGAASGITTLAAGNTTITGFANVSTDAYIGGNVGIGISSSSASKLNVNYEASFLVDNNNRGIVGWYDSDKRLGFGTINASTAYFNTMSIKDGKVGIGTNSPGDRLHVYENASYVGIKLQNQTSFLTTFVHDGLGGHGFIYKSGNYDTGFYNNDVETMRVKAGGNFQFNSGYGSVATAYGCRAWVNFNGTGTVAIRGSGNVSSITDNAVGNYNVNFTTAMPDINYSTVKGDNGYGSGEVNMSSTSFVNIRASNSTNAAYIDPSFVMVAVFR